jgi:hypothetical protein
VVCRSECASQNNCVMVVKEQRASSPNLLTKGVVPLFHTIFGIAVFLCPSAASVFMAGPL